MSKRVVILVDNKKRDLPGAALTAYHLNKLDIECFLEPLEAWRAVLYAHKPHFILFNHLLASHLENYSRELHAIGVKVGVLLNEGIIYNKEFMDFNVSKFHNSAHIDYFFVWNDVHKKAIQKINNANIKQVVTIGVPRFDFYFPPLAPLRASKAPTILLCTNFVFSKYHNKPASLADKLFSSWKDKIPLFSNYHELIKINAESRKLLIGYLDALVASEKFNIILKPHPSEEVDIYVEWYQQLSERSQQKIKVDTTHAIWELMPQCDVEIACETCTTTLEAWVAKKPTIELLLTKHPVFFHPFIAEMSLICDKPDEISKVIDKALTTEIGESSQEIKSHLSKWCHHPDGSVTKQLAMCISDAIQDTSPDFSNISVKNVRRGKKLMILRTLNLPYNYSPFSSLRNKLFPKKYLEKIRLDDKTIRPSDQVIWQMKITRKFESGTESV